jgi:hypothetical protein
MHLTSAKGNRTLINLLYLLYYKTIHVNLTKLGLNFKGVNIIIIY